MKANTCLPISVIITTYNYGRYLAQAIDSVLTQTVQVLEIIVINDGSTDNTDEVMKRYVTNPIIKYIKKMNEGQTKTKNLGIKMAKGEYIAFLDADDVWMPEKLEKQICLFKDLTVGVVFTGFCQVDEDSNPRQECKNLTMYRGYVSEQLFMDNFVCFPSSVVRKICFDKLGTFDEDLSMGIDWDLWLRFSSKYKFDFVDAPLVKYRVGHPGQMSKNTEMRFACAERIMRKYYSMHSKSISPLVYRKAWGFTWRNRAIYYRKKDRLKALQYSIRAILVDPLSLLYNLKSYFKILLG